MKCRFCNCETKEVIDLGLQPLANDLRKIGDEPAPKHELKVHVCANCFLVQTGNVISPETIFGKDYPYFSGENSDWVSHCNLLADKLMYGYNEKISVLEVGSNDGTGLKRFKELGCEVRGVDPSNSVAEYANDNEIETDIDFFGKNYALKSIKNYDLVIARNVMAHVPDIYDFMSGVYLSLKDNGTFILEFPWVKNLIEQNQFDTIYHEHYYYFSISTISFILETYGLYIKDIEDISTHGGSLRLYIGKGMVKPSEKANKLYNDEIKAGIQSVDFYLGLKNRAEKITEVALKLLSNQTQNCIMGYGAAAKASTFLNYIGCTNKLMPVVIDSSPHKQNLVIPGCDISIKSEDWIKLYKPSFIYIFAWNWKDRIMQRLSYAREWGCKFVTFIPELRIE